MRKDAHHQLLSFISMGDTWEDSLRTDPVITRPLSKGKGKKVNRTLKNRKSPYATPVVRSMSNPRVTRSKSMNSLRF